MWHADSRTSAWRQVMRVERRRLTAAGLNGEQAEALIAQVLDQLLADQQLRDHSGDLRASALEFHLRLSAALEDQLPRAGRNTPEVKTKT